MEKCEQCGNEFKRLDAHKRWCKAGKPLEALPEKTYPIGKLRKQLEAPKETDVLFELKQLRQRIESMDADRDLETSLDIQTPDEQNSQMYKIDKALKEITGDATEAILKSRFKDYDDAGRSIEKFVQRFYSTLDNTRYGGDSILVPCDEIEEGLWNMDDLKKFASWPDREVINGREYIRIFIEIASIRETLSQVARIASSDGKARLEDIHKAGAKAEGQAYVEAHTPPPDIYAKQYKEGSKKLEAAAEATLEPLDNNGT